MVTLHFLMDAQLNEQQLLRRESLNELRNLGIEPFPAEEYLVTHKASELIEDFPKNPEKYQKVCIAGRMMTRRIMGKAAFAVIQDSTAKIQVYINRDEICPEEDKTWYNTVFKKLLDIGDFMGVEGYMFSTQTGETTLHAQKITFLAKCLNPCPFPKKKMAKFMTHLPTPK